MVEERKTPEVPSAPPVPEKSSGLGEALVTVGAIVVFGPPIAAGLVALKVAEEYPNETSAVLHAGNKVAHEAHIIARSIKHFLFS